MRGMGHRDHRDAGRVADGPPQLVPFDVQRVLVHWHLQVHDQPLPVTHVTCVTVTYGADVTDTYMTNRTSVTVASVTYVTCRTARCVTYGTAGTDRGIVGGGVALEDGAGVDLAPCIGIILLGGFNRYIRYI